MNKLDYSAAEKTASSSMVYDGKGSARDLTAKVSQLL